jgi:uncharacterized membrane protein (Fun14 family)
MSSEVLLSNIIPFAGLFGYAMGFALKKILRWMPIIVGFLAGMFFSILVLYPINGVVYFYFSLMKLIGATSSILFCNFKKWIPFSVVLKVCVSCAYCIKPFSATNDRYSFN